MNDAITRFPTSRVSIDDAEYLAAQQAGAQYLLHLNPDRLLYPFRREAKPASPSRQHQTVKRYCHIPTGRQPALTVISQVTICQHA